MKKRLPLVALVILAIAIALFTIGFNNKNDNGTIEIVSVDDQSDTISSSDSVSIESALSKIQDNFDDITSQVTDVLSTVVYAAQVSDYEYAYAGFNPSYADVSVDVELILVNRDYILPSDYEPKLAISVESDANSKLLDYRVAPHYNEMYEAAAKDGIYLTTLSGYRSYSKQKTNFENKISTYINNGMSKIAATQKAATIILPPGTSEHNAGLAMDIISLEQSFENTKEFKWLKENAAEYGFVLRYPEDKQDITKIIYEPWHWRYVGVSNAKIMNEKNMCLEEYLEYIRGV